MLTLVCRMEGHRYTHLGLDVVEVGCVGANVGHDLETDQRVLHVRRLVTYADEGVTLPEPRARLHAWRTRRSDKLKGELAHTFNEDSFL